MTALLPPSIQRKSFNPRESIFDKRNTVTNVQSELTVAQSLLYGGYSSAGTPGVGLARKAPVPAESPMKATLPSGDSGQDRADGGGAKGGLSAGEMNRRDLTKVLAMLSKKPDSTEFVYLRPYLADAHAAVSERLAPLNPYHIEVVRYPETETSCCIVAQRQVAAPHTCTTAPNLLLIQYLIYY